MPSFSAAAFDRSMFMGERSAVVDADHDETAIVEILYQNLGAEWERRMRSGQVDVVHYLAARCSILERIPRSAPGLLPSVRGRASLSQIRLGWHGRRSGRRL